MAILSCHVSIKLPPPKISDGQDNLNIHCSETLVRKVAQACGIEQPLGKKGVRGVLKSVASRQAFLSEKSHRIRFVYTPKHSSWLNQIETIFGMIMRKVIRRGSFRSVKDLRDKLLNFIAYFNRVFAKPFQWTSHRSSAAGQASGVK